MNLQRSSLSSAAAELSLVRQQARIPPGPQKPTVKSSLRVTPFSIHIGEEILSDLRERIRNTRLPNQAPGATWDQGTDLNYLRQLLAYWADGFDWRAQERHLNTAKQFRAELDGVHIHFVHERARSGHGVPLILTHGWPSTFIELLPLIPFLTDPHAHGIDGPGFDVVIPSLPGYGFSDRPAQGLVNYERVAGLWHRLMRGLSYDRYGAQGGDFGAGIATFMALKNREPMIGVHLSNLEITPYTGPGARRLSTAEKNYLERNEIFWQLEGGYKAIQSTKPQTLAYGLNDSPAGLAAWILEKWRSWGDSHGNVDERFSRDFLLTTVTLYWVTQTIASSMRDYFDNDNRRFRVTMGPDDFVNVPTGIALFANNFVDEGTPPREWAERLYNVRRWTPMPSGGHFAAIEERELLARDIAAFFAGL